MANEGDGVGAASVLGIGGSVSIQPPLGEEWEIWNLFAGAAANLIRLDAAFGHETVIEAFTSPDDLAINDGRRYHLNNSNFLKITNTSGAPLLAGYAGMCTGKNKTGAGTRTIGYQEVHGSAGVTPYIDIRPPSGAVWLIEELWAENSHVLYRTGDGVNFAQMLVNAGAEAYNYPKRWMVTYSSYLRFQNTNASLRWLGYAGVVIKA